MTTLEFLSVDHLESSRGFRPLKCSPMNRRLRDAGAEFAERDGWLVATSFPEDEDRRMAIRDVTHLYRVEEAEAHVEIELDGAFGVVPPTDRGRSVVARPREGAPPVADDVTDLSAAWAGLEIEGQGATRVMHRLTELDLDDLPKVGLLSQIRALVARPGDERYLVFFAQEYGHYLWEVVVDAAKPLGGGPAA